MVGRVLVDNTMVKVVFVCMGNICRSPTADGVFTQIVETAGLSEVIKIDSAGTHAYHIGNPADPRSQECALRRGIDLGQLRARRVTERDFQEFDYVIAMDLDNYTNLEDLCPDGLLHKLKLFMDYAPHLKIKEVPDPYYGGVNGFERVFDMVEEASKGLLEDIKQAM